ncbi:sensor histidine kinase [Microbacterium gorillae]|uniref:sensor histidine kinase n=1 Tax=Microbacterium gorillae TaxID=1231063 RepID=UPI00059037A9|nr:histidine kinase [Microbacterium gorillae]
MSEALTRPAPTARELRQDLVLGVALFVTYVISAALGTVAGIWGDATDRLGWGILIGALTTLPLMFRRRFPITVATAVLAGFFLSITFRIPDLYVCNVTAFIALFTIGAWVEDRRRATWARGILIGLMFLWLLITMFITATNPNPDVDDALARTGLFSPLVAFMLLQLLMNIAFFGGAYYIGERAYRAAIEKEMLALRQRELEAEREVTSAQAVALDRVAIARELHDVVAHHVSAMGVQAGAARTVMALSPDAAAEALRGIESDARTAIAELRHLLETLRTPGTAGAGEAPSTLRLAHIPELVAKSVVVGLPATLQVIGEPRDVPELVQVNLYRIAQEALTNARRHGGPDAAADVRLRYTADAVELEVTNTGRNALSSRAGLGQLGMRERAAASGGTIEAGPRPRGGFLVRVHVPLGPIPASPVRAKATA